MNTSASPRRSVLYHAFFFLYRNQTARDDIFNMEYIITNCFVRRQLYRGVIIEQYRGVIIEQV